VYDSQQICCPTVTITIMVLLERFSQCEYLG
jgi:hypothetical protein